MTVPVVDWIAHRPEWQVVTLLGAVLVLGLYVMAVGRRALTRINTPTS